MAKLHHIVQAAMGWTDSHLHAFTFGDQRYGMHFDDYPESEIIEDVTKTYRGLKSAVCIDGQNACPPEDCGGAGGYAELLATLAHPGHQDHDRAVQWVGGPFDPTSFDLVHANVALQHLR